MGLRGVKGMVKSERLYFIGNKRNVMSCRTRDLTVDVLTHSDARLTFGKQQHFP